MLCCDFNSCDWCISILAAPVSCFLSGSLFRSSPVVVFLDCGHPCFWNFNSTIPVDVVRVKSYVNCLFDPACVPMRITINKLYLIPKRIVSGVYVLWAWSETAVVWVRATWMSRSCSFILFLKGRLNFRIPGHFFVPCNAPTAVPRWP